MFPRFGYARSFRACATLINCCHGARAEPEVSGVKSSSRLFQRDLGRHDSIDRHDPSSCWAVNENPRNVVPQSRVGRILQLSWKSLPRADLQGLTRSDRSVADCRPHLEGTPMLVLSRRKDETIVINDNIVVTVVDIQGDRVRLGFDAPEEVTIHRREVYEQIQKSKAASEAGPTVD